MSRIYECEECGEQKALMTKWRGMSCPNCGGVMKFKEIKVEKPKKIIF